MFLLKFVRKDNFVVMPRKLSSLFALNTLNQLFLNDIHWKKFKKLSTRIILPTERDVVANSLSASKSAVRLVLSSLEKLAHVVGRF